MRQTLHLLILDRDRQHALVVWYGSRWILPILDLAASVRAAPVVCDWLATRDLRGEVLGQWLGRGASNGEVVDWLIVASVQTPSGGSRSTGLRWSSLSTLMSSAHVMEYQRWALTAIERTGHSPPTRGPFGDTQWLEEATRFVGAVLGQAARESVIAAHRVCPSDVVLEWRVGRERYFLKGLARDRTIEATLTMKAYEVAPGSFARTMAFETRADGSAWWLMEACPGVPLAQQLTTHSAVAAAFANARAQQQLGRSHSFLSALPVLDLAQLAVWVVSVLESAAQPAHAAHCRSAIEEARDRIECAEIPCSWIAADLDPSNVIVNGREIRFIDLDDALLGPAPMGMSIFLRRVRRLAPECAESARRAYERAWPSSPAIGRLWAPFDLLSELLECQLGWQRLLAKTESGEVHGLVDSARQLLPARLLRICAANPLVEV